MGRKIPYILSEVGYEIFCDAEKLASLAISVVDFDINNLIWNFDLPLWGKNNESWNLTPWEVIKNVSGSEYHKMRVENTDLAYPILIVQKNNKWLIIDGVHRLVKAYLNNQKFISAKIITTDLIEKYPWKEDSKNINIL